MYAFIAVAASHIQRQSPEEKGAAWEWRVAFHASRGSLSITYSSLLTRGIDLFKSFILIN